MSQNIRTLIVIDNMEVGGIASSLYNFLVFKPSSMHCDLLVFNKDSIDKERIPADVNLINPPKLLKILGMSQSEIKRVSLILALARALLIILTRVSSGEVARRILFTFLPGVNGYDFAISYAHDNGWKSLSKGCNDYVAYKVESKVKFAYIHCDYQNYGGYDKRQERVLNKFDYVGTVSESCRNSFHKMFPSLSEKTIVLENFTDVFRINSMAKKDIVKTDNNVFTFVTVCRLSKVKGLDRTINAFHSLQLEGIENFEWFIVGDGPEYTFLVEMVRKYDLENKILFVGNKLNPYPYIKNADAFLLTSVNEAAPMVYAESAALGIPVLTTDTCSAVELVEKRGIGLVMENDEKHIMLMLKDIICGTTNLEKTSLVKYNINENPRKQLERLLDSVINKVC